MQCIQYRWIVLGSLVVVQVWTVQANLAMKEVYKKYIKRLFNRPFDDRTRGNSFKPKESRV